MTMLQILSLTVYGAGVGVALAAPVGPINIEIVRRGFLSGARNGWYVGLGALTADTIFATLIVSGVTRFADSPGFRAPLFAAGAIMLGFVGTTSLMRAIRGDVTIDRQTPSTRRSYGTGFLMAALNPLGIVYWLSVGSAIVAEAVSRTDRWGGSVMIIGVFLGIFCWVSFLAYLVHLGRRFVTTNVLRWMTGTGGILLLGFAAWFLVQTIRSINAL
jgi:threonine/homoserine/homoserine lactone efflux protein